MSFQSVLSLIHMFLVNYNAHETKSCGYGDHKVFTVCYLGRHSTLRETTDAFLTNTVTVMCLSCYFLMKQHSA